jgi:hypothetical protein
VLGGGQEDTLHSRNWLGSALHKMGKDDEAEQILREIIPLG